MILDREHDAFLDAFQPFFIVWLIFADSCQRVDVRRLLKISRSTR